MSSNLSFDTMLNEPQQAPGPVTCLGMTFATEEERRSYFTEKLREKLKDPAFRQIEGFPIGEDKAILALSDPPYYTACPNPWLADFIAEWETQKPEKSEGYHYHREPFAADVSEGKTDQFYRAHTYHTKVPYKAIARYLLHYTEPNDIVLDGFCGTGMTGVAASICGDKELVLSLGYRVDSDGTIFQEEVDESGNKNWVAFSKLGERCSILNDLSPIATFISNNYTLLQNLTDFYAEAIEAIDSLEEEIGWIYQREGKRITQGVWSDVFYCPTCSTEIIFWHAAVEDDQVTKVFSCPSCNGMVGKASSKDDGAIKLERAYETKFDSWLGKNVRVPKLVLVEETINIGKTKTRIEYKQDETDELLQKIVSMPPGDSIPLLKFEEGRQTNKLINGSGIRYVHWMYTPRALFVYGKLWDISLSNHTYTSLFRFCLTGINNYISRKQGYFGGGGGVAGTLFTPSIHLERNIFDVLRRKLKNIIKVANHSSAIKAIGTQSSTNLQNIPSNSIDYVFIDPPFGENFQYAELNSFAEAWLKVRTMSANDCVMNYVQKKDLTFYLQLMRAAFAEFYRVLKPGRWITIEFSNTQASVWNAIQLGLQEAGLVVANVSALDKQQGSFNAVTNTTSVKQDLVISAYKPNGGFEERFQSEAQSEEGVWDFIRTHLKYLPVIKYQGANLQVIPERDPRILFDQVVGYYVRQGYILPISSHEFQIGLAQRFMERDGMYFLPEQSAEYDRKKIRSGSLMKTLELFVCDEASAIQWLRQFLREKPQTSSDINPQFMQQLGGWNKNEAQLDLRELLNQNFLCYDGKDPVPEQIHAYLSSNWKDMRNLVKDDPELIAKARDRWYVPDPSKAGDLEKLRERALLKEFEEYKQVRKKLKIFRLEAVRAGFKRAWQERDYSTIVSVADKIPTNVLEEDPKLLMWYDQAVTRLGGE